MLKVSVKHYINKQLKYSMGVGNYEGEPAYPVYIRISYGRKNQRIKSLWIHHDVTEKEFENDERVKRIIKYESDIIEYIFSNQLNDDFDVKSKFAMYLDDILNSYIGWVINIKEVISEMISYISTKSGIDPHMLNPFLTNTYLSEYYTYSDWYGLAQMNIFTDDIKSKIIYLSILMEFISINYKDDKEDYEVGSVLNFYEWRRKDGEANFLSFAYKKGLLDKNIINEITKTFNVCMEERSINSKLLYSAFV